MARTINSRNLSAGSVHVHGYSARAADEASFFNSTILAYNRAAFIINELQKRGVSRELFAAPIGYGASTVWGTSPAANRRVTVSIGQLPVTSGLTSVNQQWRVTGDSSSDVNDRSIDLLDRLEAANRRAAELISQQANISVNNRGTANISIEDLDPHTRELITMLDTANSRSENLLRVLTAENDRAEELLRSLAENYPDINNIAIMQNEIDRQLAGLNERVEQLEHNDRLFAEFFESQDINWSDIQPDRSKFYTGAFLGIGPEINAHTRTGFSAGGYITGGFEILNRFAFGFKLYISHNLDTVLTFEPAVIIRYMPFDGRLENLFFEANVGSASYYEHGKAYPAPLGSIGMGWRFKFNRYFVEPTGRFGHPFTWGLGVTAGRLF